MPSGAVPSAANTPVGFSGPGRFGAVDRASQRGRLHRHDASHACERGERRDRCRFGRDVTAAGCSGAGRHRPAAAVRRLEYLHERCTRRDSGIQSFTVPDLSAPGAFGVRRRAAASTCSSISSTPAIRRLATNSQKRARSTITRLRAPAEARCSTCSRNCSTSSNSCFTKSRRPAAQRSSWFRRRRQSFAVRLRTSWASISPTTSTAPSKGTAHLLPLRSRIRLSRPSCKRTR